jgi:hypothetical protein
VLHLVGDFLRDGARLAVVERLANHEVIRDAVEMPEVEDNDVRGFLVVGDAGARDGELARRGYGDEPPGTKPLRGL